MLRAVGGADAYIRPMEQSALQKEKCRLDLAAAAIDVSGTSEKVFLLGEIMPRERRTYLYAVPDAHAKKGGFGISGLVDGLSAADAPHAVDWDRDSETYGLRYVPDHYRLSPELRQYAGEDAKAAWGKWRRVEKEIDRAVVAVAEILSHSPNADLDRTRAGIDLDAPARKRAVAPRRMSDDERS